MGLNTFFKPTLRKLILTLLIFVLLPLFLNIPPNYYPRHVSLLAAALLKLKYVQLSFNRISSGLLISYFLSSAFIWFWDGMHPEIKLEFKKDLEIFKVSKGKLLLSIIGWIALGFVWWAGSLPFGSLSLRESSPLLYELYNLARSIRSLLFPFVIVNLILFGLFQGFTKVPLFEKTYDSLVPIPSLSNYGRLSMFLFLLVEWYIVSSLIVYLFNKIRIK